MMTGTRTKRKGDGEEGGGAQCVFHQVSLSCGFDLGFNVKKEQHPPLFQSSFFFFFLKYS